MLAGYECIVAVVTPDVEFIEQAVSHHFAFSHLTNQVHVLESKVGVAGLRFQDNFLMETDVDLVGLGLQQFDFGRIVANDTDQVL